MEYSFHLTHHPKHYQEQQRDGSSLYILQHTETSWFITADDKSSITLRNTKINQMHLHTLLQIRS